jgi:hypothetical protein
MTESVQAELFYYVIIGSQRRDSLTFLTLESSENNNELLKLLKSLKLDSMFVSLILILLKLES